MNKILVAVFDSEAMAYQGLSALKDLHKDGDMTQYARSPGPQGARRRPFGYPPVKPDNSDLARHGESRHHA